MNNSILCKYTLNEGYFIYNNDVNTNKLLFIEK